MTVEIKEGEFSVLEIHRYKDVGVYTWYDKTDSGMVFDCEIIVKCDSTLEVLKG